ncbi:hypothetical protein H6504_04450 [Candidatus Woesearchaeota archaeon]|nr:hypothetical protein [Candidatus Woesearchaeota archaeon]
MDEVELGGNIRLNGFSALEPGKLVVVKKIVGNYAKRLTEHAEGFDGLSVSMKKVHGSDNFEVHSKVVAKGGPFTSEITNRNLFFALDDVLSKLEEQVSK